MIYYRTPASSLIFWSLLCEFYLGIQSLVLSIVLGLVIELFLCVTDLRNLDFREVFELGHVIRLG